MNKLGNNRWSVRFLGHHLWRPQLWPKALYQFPCVRLTLPKILGTTLISRNWKLRLWVRSADLHRIRSHRKMWKPFTMLWHHISRMSSNSLVSSPWSWTKWHLKSRSTTRRSTSSRWISLSRRPSSFPPPLSSQIPSPSHFRGEGQWWPCCNSRRATQSLQTTSPPQSISVKVISPNQNMRRPCFRMPYTPHSRIGAWLNQVRWVWAMTRVRCPWMTFSKA